MGGILLLLAAKVLSEMLVMDWLVSKPKVVVLEALQGTTGKSSAVEHVSTEGDKLT